MWPASQAFSESERYRRTSFERFRIPYHVSHAMTLSAPAPDVRRSWRPLAIISVILTTTLTPTTVVVSGVRGSAMACKTSSVWDNTPE